MTLVLFIVGAVVVTAIAFVAVGQAVGRMAVERPPAVYDLHDAAVWIGDRLPDEVTARLSYDDVARVLGWHLDWFGEMGASSRYGQELAGEAVRTEGAIAPEDAAIDAVVARSLAENGPDAVDVVCVLDLQMKYLVAIGAVGSEADD
ncbi:MAG: hypothetical protein RIB98_06975 [Acidimicrobiales bacterium]